MDNPWSREKIIDDHEVLRIIKKRSLGKSDRFSLGLVIEGGSMRGVVSAGSALALEHLELSDIFDHVYGVSAGCLTGAYFLSKQAAMGTSIFYNDIIEANFIAKKNILRSKSLMSITHLLETILTQNKPLSFDKILQSSLHIFALESESGSLTEFPQAQDRDDLLAQFRAAITLPLVGGDAVSYGDERYWDAGIHTAIPWREALSQCSHILVLLSRPRGSRRSNPGLAERAVMLPFLKRKYPAILRHYLEQTERYNQSLNELFALDKEGKNVAVVAPGSREKLVDGYSSNREAILAGAASGARAGYHRFFASSPEFYEILTPTQADGELLRSERKSSGRWWL